jgi:hypothetical protein
VLIMSHVIEHFSPRVLLEFMDGYLDRLRTGGRLIIATPLLSDYFFDDFDHVRPYQPWGLVMVFSEGSAQVQYRSRNVLGLTDLWYRRNPHRISHARGRSLRSVSRYGLIALDAVAAAIFILSGRLIGKTDGWVGVFEKMGVRGK